MISDVEALPATRKEAKAVGSKHYYTGKPCKRGHIAPRWTCSRRCLKCGEEERERAYSSEEGLKKYRKYSAEWRKRNPEKAREVKKRWRANNTEKHLEGIRKWKEENREHVREYDRAWRQRDPERSRLRSTLASQKRRAAELNATPSWADQTKIYSFYWLRATKSEVYGIEYHVDHIIPLNNPLVCGLHNEFNLQVIPASENLSKGNSFIPH